MAINKLTHDECCALVEGAIERGLQTLLYIRKRLGKKGTMDEWMEKHCSHVKDVLCDINHYGAYLSGARAMYLALKDQSLLVTPKETITYGNKKFVEGNSLSDKEQRVVNAALLKLYLDNARNMEWLLHGAPDNVELRVRYELDKKGKVAGATAMFAKKVTTYEEIK